MCMYLRRKYGLSIEDITTQKLNVIHHYSIESFHINLEKSTIYNSTKQ